MQVIPVVDVRGGVAVAASRGDRANYRPLASPLAAGADPVAVADGLRTLFPFSVLYVADLDGIEGRGADEALQNRLCKAWLGAEVWIDGGAKISSGTDREMHAWQTQRRQVLGSESFASVESYAAISQNPLCKDAPLSLDFRGDAFIGPPSLLEDVSLWPARVIVMTLGRVGSGEGPDFARLASVVGRAGVREIYAAGGVRDGEDLRTLRDMGVAGALVATALHTGKIKSADIEMLA